MTFYESNDDVRDTGAEVAEFDDAPPAREARDGGGSEAGEGADDRKMPGSRQPPER